MKLREVKRAISKISKVVVIPNDNVDEYHKACIELSKLYNVEELKYLRQQFSYDANMLNVISTMLIEKVM